MTLQEPYRFIDRGCTEWAVPKGAVVDGASIPSALWSIIGGPFEGTYRNASVIHDWFCSVRTREWQDVHQMFYDAMRVSGVAAMTAKLMYFGVYYGGPRWDFLTIRNSRVSMAAARGLMQIMPNRRAHALAIGMPEAEYVKRSAEEWNQRLATMPPLNAEMLNAASTMFRTTDVNQLEMEEMAERLQHRSLVVRTFPDGDGGNISVLTPRAQPRPDPAR